jgi:hypothetical protein
MVADQAVAAMASPMWILIGGLALGALGVSLKVAPEMVEVYLGERLLIGVTITLAVASIAWSLGLFGLLGNVAG